MKDLDTAEQNIPNILALAMEHERKVNKLIIADLRLIETILFTHIKKQLDGKSELEKEKFYNDLYEQFKTKLFDLKKEFEIFENFYTLGKKPIQLKTNKIGKFIEILLGSIETSKDDFIRLLKTGFINTLKINEKQLPLPDCNDPKNSFGNSNFSLIALTYLINISLLTEIELNKLLAKNTEYFSLNGEQIRILIKPISITGEENVVEYESIPAKSSFITKVSGERLDFYTIGKGYEFGGTQRDGTHDDYERHDCSSWVCKLARINRCSTKDLMEGKFTLMDSASQLETVSVQEARPGDIMCWQGHIGFIHKVLAEKGKIALLSYLREVPDYEGIGYRDFEIQSDKKPRKFFRSK